MKLKAPRRELAKFSPRLASILSLTGSVEQNKTAVFRGSVLSPLVTAHWIVFGGLKTPPPPRFATVSPGCRTA